MNAAGPSIERSTWHSAAKFSTASGRCSASRRETSARSPSSAWMKTWSGLPSRSLSDSRLPAYVSASRLTTRRPEATASSTKLPPMKPAPPVTSQVCTPSPSPCRRIPPILARDPSPARNRSERNVVVGEVFAEVGLGRRRGLAALGRRATLLRALLALAPLAAAFAAATAKHLHLVGDDVGEVLLDAVLAGELVVADR